MKKSTKSTKPAAPQAKSSEPKIVEPKPAKKTAAPRKKSTPANAVPAAVLEESPVVSVVSPIESVSVAGTTISAVIDVGFGNALFIRGEGPGLSWEKGRPLECVAEDKWTITLGELTKPASFKFLLNDQTWCAGADYVIEPGQSVTLEPAF